MSRNITEVSPKDKLLRFFTSEKFDIFGAVDYMNRTNRAAVRDFLVNQLYDFKIRDVEFIIPQLW